MAKGANMGNVLDMLQVFADDGQPHREQERRSCVSYDSYEFEVGSV